MSIEKLRNVDRFVDRHGKPRHYFRIGRGQRVRLLGEFGSPEFMQAYQAAAAEATLPDAGRGFATRDSINSKATQPSEAVRP